MGHLITIGQTDIRCHLFSGSLTFPGRESGFRSDVPHRLYASKLALPSSFLSDSWIEGNGNNLVANSVVSVRPMMKSLEI